MKRPSFQFYPGDWTGNSNLRRCTHAEKGVWLEVMCLMHDQAEYGVLRWPLKEIVEAVKCKPADIRALVSKGVLKGSDDSLPEPFIYTPRSGRKDGEPVTLLDIQPGPIWYSSRMVKDEYVRTIRGGDTRFGEESGESPKRSPKPPFGDGASSSSSSSTSVHTPKPPKSGVRSVDAGEGFDEFYLAYPRKIARQDAVKAWNKLSPDEALRARIMAALKAQQFDTRDGGRFIPYPASWLNSARWDDQLDLGDNDDLYRGAR